MSAITRIRNKHFDRWFTVDLAIHELPAHVLSPEGKAFHLYLSSRPDGWEYNRQAAINTLGSGYKVDKATAELKALELLEVRQVRQGGRYMGYEWHIEASLSEKVKAELSESDTPDPELPDSDIPDPDTPDPEYQDPVIQETLKEIPLTKKLTLLKEQTITHDEPIDYFNLDSENENSQDENQATPGTSKESADIQADLAAAGCGKVEKPKRSRKPKDPEVPKHDPEAFAALKEQYWGTIDPVKSAKEWDKLKPDAELVGTLFHFVAEAKEGIWKDQDPKYITHLHNFLNGHGWKVQYKKSTSPPPAPRHAQTVSEDEQMEYLRSYL